MTFRFSLILAMLLLSGCQLTQKPAPLMAIPKKPPLAKRVYEVAYNTPVESARVKSVQLPAHPIARGDTVSLSASKVSLTDTLKDFIVSNLTAKGLKIVDGNQGHYVLTIHQLDLEFAKDRLYQLQVSGNAERLEVLSSIPQQMECKSILASVSMRLTHQKSSDVVWFAKASIDSASYQAQPLRFQISKEQQVSNEQQVMEFVESQNTEEARKSRSSTQVKVPKYVVKDVISPLQKQSGACNETEVSALTADMQKQLSKLLIDKINVK
ncbi:hypothetical protein [Pseudoalteromonas xiamenensis]|uniref:Lipoprotein n=1 Tax=Pseudoalteromonas xiamenensis TaxID=882626 RepID=A0A975DHL5_9GAMM|nr:hypothetical protein [Pseudoalteromonas xiamenensis]QTH71345.1 hypothetical protein J5O05_16400 [Pseudoalteromonas xiamenensis]